MSNLASMVAEKEPERARMLLTNALKQFETEPYLKDTQDKATALFNMACVYMNINKSKALPFLIDSARRGYADAAEALIKKYPPYTILLSAS